MNETLGFKKNLGLVHGQARRGFAWAQLAQAPFSYEDMFQEASLAFVLAWRGFDPDAGVGFPAYYARVAHGQLRQAIGRMTDIEAPSAMAFNKSQLKYLKRK